MRPPQSALGGKEALEATVASSLAVVQHLQTFVHGRFQDADGQCSVELRKPTDLAGGMAQLSVTNSQPSALVPSAAASSSSTTNGPDRQTSLTEVPPLSLAGDAATLIRAHATKISLLIINEPFTPSAIGKVVQELVAGPVPALATAVEACVGTRYTYRVLRSLAWRCERVLHQVASLLQSIPTNGQVVPSEDRSHGANRDPGHSTAAPPGRGSFTDIGVLWTECDSVVALAKEGPKAHLVKFVENLAETLKDELEELKEWGEEADDDDDDGGLAVEAADINSGSDEHAAAQSILDDLMNAGSRHIPADDPDALRPRLEWSLKKLQLIVLFFKAVIKRRLRKLPELPDMAAAVTSTRKAAKETVNTATSATKSQVSGTDSSDESARVNAENAVARLDRALVVLKALPERVGDLAEAFYELEAGRVDAVMARCLDDAFVASELLMLTWDEKQDEFTNWALKFQTEIRTALTATRGRG